jgi:hypothetical protein
MMLTKFLKNEGEHIDKLYARIYCDFVRSTVWEYKSPEHKVIIKKWDMDTFKQMMWTKYDL